MSSLVKRTPRRLQTIAGQTQPSSAEKRATRKAKLKERKRHRRASYEINFSAWVLAGKYGLLLDDCGTKKPEYTRKHYQLRQPRGFLLNIYPGSRGLHYEPNRPGPAFEVAKNWTVYDVVKAVADAMNRREQQS